MTSSTQKPREAWATRIGLILAVSGNAIGLGNFLRFPVQCAGNGGGAFMIPYFISLLLLGIPIMWVEWAMGRFGGHHGHGTTPGMFHRLWHHPMAKYLGAFGLLITFGVAVYYVYVESWTLAYAFFSVSGKFTGITTHEQMGQFLSSFQGKTVSPFFNGMGTAYVFFLITFGLNIWVLWNGVSGGIEKLARIAMPALFIFAIILVIRIFTMGTPDPQFPDRSVLNGLGFMWNPDFATLTSPKVWLAAAGQIFFTLSVGFGCIQTYASYVKRDQDIALNGLTTCATNEFAEVILGGSIAIPIAVAFFGIAGTAAIAHGGAFDLGFQAMPLIFQKIPLGPIFGMLWFVLLFFAGITSSVAIVQPAIAFFQDEFNWSRKKAVGWVGFFWFLLAHAVILYLNHGFLDEMDFWFGTFGVVFFAFVEVMIFIWIFSPKKAWEEITHGADIKVPKVFLFILKYITPSFLLILLVTWGLKDGLKIARMEGVGADDRIYVIGARVMMTALFALCLLLVRQAFKHKAHKKEAS